ncbi:MAG: hypothetical protein WC955_04230 [Elusimicrobiota bacterium]
MGLTQNPDFEIGTATGWYKSSISTWTVVSSTDGYKTRSGTYALQVFDIKTGYVYQVYTATAGKYYNVSGWIQDDDTNGSARVMVYWRNLNGSTISSESTAYTVDASEYQECRLTRIHAPAGTVDARVEVYFNTQDTGAVFYIDDIVFTEYDTLNESINYSSISSFEIIDKTFYPYTSSNNCRIAYNLPSGKVIKEMVIYDITGIAVRKYTSFVNPQNGYITWDGYDENNNVLPMGVYIIAGVTSENGGPEKKEFKTVTLMK